MSRATAISAVYIIRNTEDGKVYVGKSVDVKDRWRHHCRLLRKRAHANPHLQSAWDKYGCSSFSFEILEEAEAALLPSLEEKWTLSFDALNREHGYKLDRTTPTGKVMSAETRARIGAANKGKVRTPEMRAQMSAAKQGQGKGRVKTPTEVERLRLAHARRATDPNGYSWFQDPENKELLRSAGKLGARRRWGTKKEDTDGP